MTLSGSKLVSIVLPLGTVLIPLLVDDPLREESTLIVMYNKPGLNPSFSGWPSPGLSFYSYLVSLVTVLIPLLVDDPLRALQRDLWKRVITFVLIPLLVDDPLRGIQREGWLENSIVLIPLLVDDPLRENKVKLEFDDLA